MRGDAAATVDRSICSAHATSEKQRKSLLDDNILGSDAINVAVGRICLGEGLGDEWNVGPDCAADCKGRNPRVVMGILDNYLGIENIHAGIVEERAEVRGSTIGVISPRTVKLQPIAEALFHRHIDGVSRDWTGSHHVKTQGWPVPLSGRDRNHVGPKFEEDTAASVDYVSLSTGRYGVHEPYAQTVASAQARMISVENRIAHPLFLCEC